MRCDDAGVALRDLGLALDDEAGLEVMLVPEVHLGAGVDCRLRQREAEAVVAHQQPLRAPAIAAHVRSVPVISSRVRTIMRTPQPRWADLTVSRRLRTGATNNEGEAHIAQTATNVCDLG